MKQADDRGGSRRQRSFAITSLGTNRWFWVVWPSLEQLESGDFGRGPSWGYERTKADAVDRALEAVGPNGKWLAAKYAKQYHKFMRTFQSESRGRPISAASPPAATEFLYQDVRDELTGTWRSVRHRVGRKTGGYVYVEQRVYDGTDPPDIRLGDTGATLRLSRKNLKRDGYALAPVTADVDDPMFFLTPFHERVTQPGGRVPSCLERLGLPYPATTAQVKAAYRQLAKNAHPDRGGNNEEFLALQAAYEQALTLCRD
jgi:hypothetical protein